MAHAVEKIQNDGSNATETAGMLVFLLELLKLNFPEKSGEVNAWKFEKAHSILHKVR